MEFLLMMRHLIVNTKRYFDIRLPTVVKLIFHQNFQLITLFWNLDSISFRNLISKSFTNQLTDYFIVSPAVIAHSSNTSFKWNCSMRNEIMKMYQPIEQHLCDTRNSCYSLNEKGKQRGEMKNVRERTKTKKSILRFSHQKKQKEYRTKAISRFRRSVYKITSTIKSTKFDVGFLHVRDNVERRTTFRLPNFDDINPSTNFARNEKLLTTNCSNRFSNFDNPMKINYN